MRYSFGPQSDPPPEPEPASGNRIWLEGMRVHALWAEVLSERISHPLHRDTTPSDARANLRAIADMWALAARELHDVADRNETP